MGLSLPKSNLIFLKKCLDKWVHFTWKIAAMKEIKAYLEEQLQGVEGFIVIS